MRTRICSGEGGAACAAASTTSMCARSASAAPAGSTSVGKVGAQSQRDLLGNAGGRPAVGDGQPDAQLGGGVPPRRDGHGHGGHAQGDRARAGRRGREPARRRDRGDGRRGSRRWWPGTVAGSSARCGRKAWWRARRRGATCGASTRAEGGGARARRRPRGGGRSASARARRVGRAARRGGRGTLDGRGGQADLLVAVARRSRSRATRRRASGPSSSRAGRASRTTARPGRSAEEHVLAQAVGFTPVVSAHPATGVDSHSTRCTSGAPDGRRRYPGGHRQRAGVAAACRA